VTPSPAVRGLLSPWPSCEATTRVPDRQTQPTDDQMLPLLLGHLPVPASVDTLWVGKRHAGYKARSWF